MSNRPTRLVLVTNNVERASTVERIATDNGWQLLPCVRRPIPFELLDHLRIDLFLVDLDLENAFEQVRELARRPNAKVIVLASAEQMANLPEVTQIGAKASVLLPLDAQNLIATINQFVNGATAQGRMPGFMAPPRQAQPPIKEAAPSVLPTFNSSQLQNGSTYNEVSARTPEPLHVVPVSVAMPPQQQPFAGYAATPSGHTGSPPPQYQAPMPTPAPAAVYTSSPQNHPQYPGSVPANGNGTNGFNNNNGYPNGYAPNGHGPQNFAPNGNAPQGYAPNGHAPQGYAANGNAPQGYAANGYMPNGYAPTPTNRLIAVTGLRGGVGRSTIAVNLAVALRQRSNSNVILAEAHHGLGNLALLMNMLPRHTLASLTEGDAFDIDIMRSVVQQHSSGVQLFSAPLDVAQLVEFAPETWRNILSLLKQMAQYVVVDTSAYADTVLSEVLTAADEIIIVCGPDILSMRSTMSLLETLRAERENVQGRVQLILNRAGVRGGLDESTLQKQLREKITVSLTDDAPLATYALNRGVPFVLSHNRSSLARSINSLVDQYHVPQVPAVPTKKPFALLPMLNRG